MPRAMKPFAILLVCLILLQLLEFAISNNCGIGNQTCQNSGYCVQQGSSLECQCPCNYTGAHCELKNWCQDAKFDKIGCFATQANKDVLFNTGNTYLSSLDSVWNWYLENITCSCALAAKVKGFRYFSVEESSLCAGYNEMNISSGDNLPNGCLGKVPNRNQCEDADTLVACVGSVGHEYVYELSEIDQQQCATSGIRDCSDYDYFVRFMTPSISHYFGPIPDGLPAGKSFSYCLWQKLSFMGSHRFFLVSYSIQNNANEYYFGIRSEATRGTYNLFHNIQTTSRVTPLSSPSVFDKWVHICDTVNFGTGEITTYIDSEELHRHNSSSWTALAPNGKLFIGHDQDAFGGDFQTSDACVGDITQFNVWDFLLDQNDVREIFHGVGTETGNFLAWVNLKSYLKGPAAIGGSPMMKWTGKGCQWEERKCDIRGLCRGGFFRCPCNNSALAPRSCFSSKIYETTPCSDYDYVLEFPPTNNPPAPKLAIDNVMRTTSTLSVCLWLKIAPEFTDFYTVINIVDVGAFKCDSCQHFFIYIRNDQSGITLRNGGYVTWTRSGTFADNQWRHFCMVKNDKTFGLYEDGTLLQEKVLGWAIDIPGKVTVFLGYSDTWSYPGSIAHFNIWDYVLTVDEVSALANGARTRLGNLLSWPQVKHHIDEGIKIVRPSPLMKWTDLNCQWSDDSCGQNQICQGRKFTCQPVPLNSDAIAPYSCADFSYIPIEKIKTPNWKNNIVDVLLVSRDGDVFQSLDFRYSSIFVNDVEYKFRNTGMHFMTLSAKTGEVYGERFYCNTYADNQCGTKITSFLDGLRSELVILMVVTDSSHIHYHGAIPAMRSNLGESLDIPSTLEIRDAMAIIGYKGSIDVPWRYFKVTKRGDGPAILKSTIPLLRESCLDHLYTGAREDGVYAIYPPYGSEITVFCEFTTNGGGWTVLQRRHNDRITFARNLDAYRDGFGPVDGEFWLGNQNIHSLGKGQLLATFVLKETGLTYDLYNQFSVSSTFSLDVHDRSGLNEDGIFNRSSGAEVPFLTYETDNSKCLGNSDGGWWFEATCRGKNPNAKKEKCGTPFVSSEIMMRPRLPARDIVIKEIPNTISWEEGMNACDEDGMLLCPSMEICRDGRTPYGGADKDPHFVPVADKYNNWMNIGRTPCTITVDPGWGTDNSERADKGKLFCCSVITKARGVMSKLKIPSTMSYQDGENECRKTNRRLCSIAEICPDFANPVYGNIEGDQWVPVVDKYNEWVQVGTGWSPCKVHSKTGSSILWGITNVDVPWKGYLFCCPVIPKARGIVKKRVPSTSTYKDGMDVCSQAKRRLCSSKEICSDGFTPHGGVIPVDHWTPVFDNYNDWLQIGDYNMYVNCLPCMRHSLKWGFPRWGTDGSNKDSKTYLFCCADIREGTVDRTWRYDLKFSGNQGHVRFKRITPLRTFSICWWIMINSAFEGWGTVFSHWNRTSTKQLIEFSLNSRGGYQLTIGGDERESKFPVKFTDRSDYHHMCVTWNGLTRSAKVYRDGSLAELFQNIGTDKILPEGSLVIGQTLKANLEFDTEHSLRGVLTRFNVWDRELEDDVINQFSLFCGEEEGSIIAWPEVKLWISDGVEIEEGEACFPANCLDYVYRNKKENGIYQIKPHRNQSSFSVYCDQKTAGGGWTVIGRRLDNKVRFHDFKYFSEYKRGFGDLDHEFWLGNEKIYRLTSARTEQLHLSGWDEHKKFVKTYQRFQLGREYNQYSMYYRDPIPAHIPPNLDGLAFGKKFLTRDKDSADACGLNCGAYWHGGQDCVYSNLFGDWHSGGCQGAQWFGKDAGKLRNLEMKVRPTDEFKKSLPVLYMYTQDLTWNSAQDFCQNRNSDLCYEDDICPGGGGASNYPFGSSLWKFQTVPVLDKRGAYINIGESNRCKPFFREVETYSHHTKRYVFCCQGYPKRDWRFDLRIPPSSTGHISIEAMPMLLQFTVCWWMRVPQFDQEWATVFAYLSEAQKEIKFSYKSDGKVKLRLKYDRILEVPSMIDDNWHHYCVKKRVEKADFYFDGQSQGSTSLHDTWLNGAVTVGRKLVIGQDMNVNGDIVSGRGMVGELSRFNWWHKDFTAAEITEQSKKCGNDVGNIIAWPQLKYWIVGDVEVLEGTTCIKPAKHLWFLNEVENDGYQDVFSEYVASVIPDTAAVAGLEALTLDRSEKYVMKDELLDDCIADPGMCRKTGLTIAMWLKRKGLVSDILPESHKSYEILLKWLDDVAPAVSDWLPCYNATGLDLDTTKFHEECDYKGATVTLVKVKGYIFGGFSNENWGGSARSIPSNSAFLFSLSNPHGVGAVKLDVVDNNAALFTDNTAGPAFGNDLNISSHDTGSGDCCSSVLGQAYSVPAGYVLGTDKAKHFFTSHERFSIDFFEVFYAYVPSEPVGIADAELIKDSQMTASSFKRHTAFSPYFARLNNVNNMWKTAFADKSPWLQVKLVNVTWIKKIAIQGCDTIWIKTFQLNFSMDGISWTTYKEHMSEKIFTANSNGTTVVENTLINSVETRYVRVVPVDRTGGNACMRIELYASVKVCPTVLAGAAGCSQLGIGNIVSQLKCENAGCCYTSGGNCYSKQADSLQAVGMESKALPDENILASTWSGQMAPHFARLNLSYVGWKPSENNSPQWLQIELNKDETLTHVATQGNTPNKRYKYCKSYILHYRKPTGAFVVYEENGKARLFRGYSDSSKIVKNLFLQPFRTRFVRLYPQPLPSDVVRIELYRLLNDFGTTIISTDANGFGGTGLSFTHQTVSQYRFAVKLASRSWEVLLDRIPYRWTHFTFTWSENWGIQFYENGVWKSESVQPSQYRDILFKQPSDSLRIGKDYNLFDEIIPQIFTIMDLTVVKRQILPSEVKSFIYEVPCTFSYEIDGKEPGCKWEMNDWSRANLPTQSYDTGPEKGLAIKQPYNWAYLKQTSQSSTHSEHGMDFSSFLAVDGKINEYFASNNLACAWTLSGAASWWRVDLGARRDVDVVLLYREEDTDPYRNLQYKVSVSFENSLYEMCSEFNDGGGARSYSCNQTNLVQFVRVETTNNSLPLALCEVAVYSLLDGYVYAFLESSYPRQKGFSSRIFTTRKLTNAYNCLQFYYHMHGFNMGRLNVFGSDMDENERMLLWRLAGDQGEAWRSAMVKIENHNVTGFGKVMFEAVVGDDYLSDIAVDNVSFTVNSQCQISPPGAKPTLKVVSNKRKCYCISKAEGASSDNLILSNCTALSSGFEWLPGGILKHGGKCLRPNAGPLIVDGTPLILSDVCTQKDVAFRLTPTGAIQHRTSLLCIQPYRWMESQESDQLVLGRKGCDYIHWLVARILVKGQEDTGYSKQTVLKLGIDDTEVCSEEHETLMPFIPADFQTSQLGSRVFALQESTDKFLPATVLKVNQTDKTFQVLFDGSGNAVVKNEDSSMMLSQPLKGSAIMTSRIGRTSILAKWINSHGVFSEFWKPCMHLTRNGISNFTCATNVSTLLIIRKDHNVIGGFMGYNSEGQESLGNFLFSFDGSSHQATKFDEISKSSVSMTRSGMAFGENGEELSLTWEQLVVINRPGRFFAASDIKNLIGNEQFTATDFEVLQPRDEICVPGCNVNEICDEITSKCVCDYTGRPPAWCLTGAASETIYADADHYWSMDSLFNIIDHKAERISWALVEGEIHENVGVNDMSVEFKNGDGKIELLHNDRCFRYPAECSTLGITVSFWFKSIEQQDSDLQGRVFYRTYTDDGYTGYYMYQGDSRGRVIFEARRRSSTCTYNIHIEPNVWSFLTVTHKKSTFQIFRNGENVTPETSCGSSLQSTVNTKGQFVLGNGGNLASALFDDVAIWYRKLDDDEIAWIYGYYYKDPPILVASLEASFPALVGNVHDKESQVYIDLENRILSTFGSLFPKQQENTSFVLIGECRDVPKLVCEIKLNLVNYSDYENIEFLLEKNAPQSISLSNIITKNVPYEPTVISGSSSEPSTIELEWNLNDTNIHQGFIIRYSTNKTNETFNVTKNKVQSFYNLTNLIGSSYYEISFAVYTLAGLGKWSEPLTIKTVEDVPKYSPGNLTGHNVSSTELAFQWDAVKEENSYESIRGYVVYVTEASNPSVVIKNITTDSSTLLVKIDDLRKFTVYNLYIKALTVDVGVKSMSFNVSTAEDAPDAPPTNLTVFNSSSTSLRIEFKPVPKDLINGVLRGYRVFYFKTRDGNHTRKNFTLEKEQEIFSKRRKRSVDEYYESYPLFANIFGLDEYTNYTIQIQAITIEDGVLAPPYTTLTAEDLPSMAPPNVTARNTSSTSIFLEWDLIPEDDWNGILLGYVLYYSETGGNEVRFVHRSTSLFVEIQELEKYTMYGFELTVFNSIGESNRSSIVYCQTDQDKPDAPPHEVTGIPTSPSTMGVVWKPVPPPLERGIILGYRFVFSTMAGDVLVSKTLRPEQLFISVADLELFTNYTVNMTAFTIKGDGPWSSEVVLSLQLAPGIAPANLSARSHSTLNSIPVSWIKVPLEKTKGYITGYKLYIRLISVGLEDIPDTRVNEIILKGAHRTSYTLQGLDYFSKYKIYLIAFTSGGDSPTSNIIYAETCRCGPVLSTQWTNVAPYTNITKPEEVNGDILKNNWGIFPYIVNDAVQFCCRSCESHDRSVVDFARNQHNAPGEVYSYGELMHSIDGLTDLTFPVYGYVGMTLYHNRYKYTPLIESPGSAFIVRKEESNMSGLVISNVIGNWPLFVMMTCMSLVAGAIIWILELRANPEEFPPNAFKGIANGFWWAYVSMTTVGYGDRSPRSIPGRIFAIMWTLTGLVITGMMVGDLASSLTVSVSDTEKMIYNTQVGAIDLSPEFRLGIRLNGKMNKATSYQNLEDLRKALLVGEIDGILLDAYVVGSRNDLFKNPNFVINRIKDYKATYGIVWAGKSARIKVCLDWYIQSRKSSMFTHIAENLVIAKKIEKTDVSEEMANLFDPTTEIYTKTLFLCLIGIGALVVLGLVYEIIRRLRRARKIKPQGGNDFEEKKIHIAEMQKFLQKSFSGLIDDMHVLKARHLKQFRLFVSKQANNGPKWFWKSRVHPSPS